MIIPFRFDAFEDERGTIRDLIRDEEINSVTLIHTKHGAVRGNHYHRATIQWTYVLRGRLLVVTQLRGEDVKRATLRPGELMLSPPHERHAWQAIGATDCLVFTSGPRAGTNYESDVVRMEEPLI